MAEPRKKKRKTGRPLEDVPLRTLVKRVREKLVKQVKVSFSDSARKPKKEEPLD
jgi:hypothetical protein